VTSKYIKLQTYFKDESTITYTRPMAKPELIIITMGFSFLSRALLKKEKVIGAGGGISAPVY
jgi:hypothetical protein